MHVSHFGRVFFWRKNWRKQWPRSPAHSAEFVAPLMGGSFAPPPPPLGRKCSHHLGSPPPPPEGGEFWPHSARFFLQILAPL